MGKILIIVGLCLTLVPFAGSLGLGLVFVGCAIVLSEKLERLDTKKMRLKDGTKVELE